MQAMTARSVHAFTDDLARLDAVATTEAVRRGDVSVPEVVEAAIARAEALDGELGAIATPDFDRARATAATVTRGPLVGVPTFIKDNMDQVGLPTKEGSKALAHARPAKANGGVTAQLLDMGMISLGKSSLPEFGFAPSCETLDGTATRNPWNLDHTTGGSSAGAAALVAAGVVPVAHGADGGGSIRIPSACCGLVGLKVSRGRLVPDLGSKLMPVDIVTEGLLTRSVRDLALHLAEAEKRYRKRSLPAVGHVTAPVRRSLRIGVVTEAPLGAGLDAANQQALKETVALLEELGHQVTPITFPGVEAFAADFLQYWSMLIWTVVNQGQRLFDPSFDKTQMTPFSLMMAQRFRDQIRTAPANIVRMRGYQRTYRAMYQSCDVVLAPTLATVAPPIGHLASDMDGEILLERLTDWMPFTPLANGTGLPAISLPMGHDDELGLPVGMMFQADLGADALLVELALQLEAAHPWRTLAP